MVVLATPWDAVPAALRAAGSLDGQVLQDCTNALKPDLSGLAIGTTTSAAVTIQHLVPGARVVKGMTPFAELLLSGLTASVRTTAVYDTSWLVQAHSRGR